MEVATLFKMDKFEAEVKELREKNNELVQKVQFWKMKAAQQENDKLDLMRENKILRLKLSRLRSGGADQAQALDAALQAASEEALSNLVQASSAVARTIEITKNYIRERQALEAELPRWSNIGGTPMKEKVHKVAPMMGGRSLQPFVNLRRMPVDTPSPLSVSSNISERILPLPMHVLQDVYIPLRRIDTELINTSNHDDDDENEEGADDMLLEDSAENEMDDSHNTTDDDERRQSRELEVLHEDLEEAIPLQAAPMVNTIIDNPLEGPSWLLDVPQMRKSVRSRIALEADSTTEPDEAPTSPVVENVVETQTERHAFTPTVRRRKRTSSPHSPRRESMLERKKSATASRGSGRELKVLIAKMCISPSQTPPQKRPMFDSPSHNGATDDALIVMEDAQERISEPRELSVSIEQDNSNTSRSNCSRDSDDGRGRRKRKQVVYKEKPLNRKMRR